MRACDNMVPIPIPTTYQHCQPKAKARKVKDMERERAQKEKGVDVASLQPDCKFDHSRFVTKAEMAKLKKPKSIKDRNVSNTPRPKKRATKEGYPPSRGGSRTPSTRGKRGPKASSQYCFTYYRTGKCEDEKCTYPNIPKEEVDRKVAEEKKKKN